MISQLQWMWKNWQTQNLIIYEWSDDKLIAMNVERIGEKRTIWKFTNDSILQLMWKDLANNEQFEKSRMIGWHVNCDECGNFCKKRTIWKFTNDSMISQMQLMWKNLANNAQFENSQMIGWQVNSDK